LTDYLDLADYLLIAEAVLGVPAEEITVRTACEHSSVPASART